MCLISKQTWLRMSAAHSAALARLRIASDGSAIGCSLLLLNRSIGLGWRRWGVRLQALGVARGRRHGLLELANVSVGDAAADLREALGAARLPVAEDLLAKDILGSSNATLPALVGLVLAVTDPGLGSSFAARIHDAPALSSLTEDGRARRTRPEHLLA